MSPGGTYERDLYKSAALHATDCQHLRVTFATLPNWLFLARSKAGAGGGIQKMTWRNLLTLGLVVVAVVDVRGLGAL